jgi:cytohesin
VVTIFEAVAAGDPVLLDSLIAAGADVHARSDTGLTALHLAAERGDLDAALALLDAGADPDAPSLGPAPGAPAGPAWPGVAVVSPSTREGASVLAGLFGRIWEASKPKRPDVQGHTPLAGAAAGGHTDVLRLLLDRGADANARDGDGITALALAVTGGHRGAMELLIARGADPEARTRDGLTPLMLAASDGRLGFVRALLDAGADPNAESKALIITLTPLGMAAQKGHHEVVDALIAAGAKVARIPLETGLALAKAVKGDRQDLVRSLIAAGADLHSQAGGGDHLHAAAERGLVGMIRLLIGAGAKLEARSYHVGKTPLMVAAEHGQEQAVVALLAAGADVHAPGATPSGHLNGSPALVLAAEVGHTAVVRALLAAGADPNARIGRSWRDSGKTPLILASRAGHLEAARALLEGGASVHVKDELPLWNREGGSFGQTALGYVARADRPELVSLLLDAGAYPDARDERGVTPLIRAAYGGKAEIIRRLLAAGAEVRSPARDEEGRTALEAAAMWGDPDVYRTLRDAGAEAGRPDKRPEALRFAASRGETSMVDCLLAEGVDVDDESDEGATALASAAMVGTWRSRGSSSTTGPTRTAGRRARTARSTAPP